MKEQRITWLLIVTIALAVIVITACSDNPTVNMWVQPSDIRLSEAQEIRINFSLSGNATISLSIHDQVGRLVRSLINSQEVASGAVQTHIWDGRDNADNIVTTGEYFILLSTGRQRHIEQIVILR